MSGTSADGVDAVLVNLSFPVTLVGQLHCPLPLHLRSEIHQLALPGPNEIDRLGLLDLTLGELFAEATLNLLKQTGYSAQQVRAIGSHGQTIRHRPGTLNTRGFTLQIADPNTIAQRTGITTVADFRRRDMAAGGQGAPLVPGFHRAVFQHSERDRVIANIGGIANLTWLSAKGDVIGFDTGPGNCLMDAWIGTTLGKTYDKDGAWAASGQTHGELLKHFLEHDFFKLPHPKSTGKETFNLGWATQVAAAIAPKIPAVNIQSTLLELTARTLTDAIRALVLNGETEIFICGGGAYNNRLMTRLQELLPQYPVLSTDHLGIAPEHVEAMAFAWLAKQTLERRPGNICSVTGANADTILGGIYYA